MSGQCGLNPLSLALWDLLSKQFLAARPEEKAFVGHAARQDRTAQYRQEQHENEHQAMNVHDIRSANPLQLSNASSSVHHLFFPLPFWKAPPAKKKKMASETA
jgi:hypothetical protein